MTDYDEVKQKLSISPGESAKDEFGFRDNDLKIAIVDVVYRNNKDLNIIVYVQPGVNPASIDPAIRKTCIDLFGHIKPDYIDTVFYSGDSIGLQVDGMVGQFDSFCITINYPKSAYFKIEKLKSDFTKRLHHHVF